jgi:hypothetical protein
MQRTSGPEAQARPHVTTDHAAIRRWVEARGGHPAVVTGAPGADDHLLRIDLPGGYAEQEFLEPVSWAEFFRRFDEKRLAFEYDDEGRFFRFVTR